MTQAKVLVIDDEESICWTLRRMLEREGHEVSVASSVETGLKQATPAIDLVLLDVRLPGEDGVSAIPKFTREISGKPVVIMTAFGDLETAVSAVKQGARDYLTKPFRLEEVRAVCRALLSESSRTADATKVGNDQSQVFESGQIVGRSAAIQKAFRQIALVADSDLSVLITGETGTGKELVAAAIHRHSQRSGKPYVPIAPVALNEQLIESELFGHVKGAFTGATEDRAGLFERAEGGTVLLDEIGDLPLHLQLKLLRVLEEKKYTRVGDTQERCCDVRVLAATNANLRRSVEEGSFREDLFYRLNGMQIHLPPLRERLEDIEPLTRFFLSLHDRSSEQFLSEDFLNELKSRTWHGNVRELKNSIGHAAVVARGRELIVTDLPEERISTGPASTTSDFETALQRWFAEQTQSDDVPPLIAALMAEIEPKLFRLALQHTQDNRATAAKLLGIHRGTLRDKLRLYGISE